MRRAPATCVPVAVWLVLVGLVWWSFGRHVVRLDATRSDWPEASAQVCGWRVVERQESSHSGTGSTTTTSVRTVYDLQVAYAWSPPGDDRVLVGEFLAFTGSSAAEAEQVGRAQWNGPRELAILYDPDEPGHTVRPEEAGGWPASAWVLAALGAGGVLFSALWGAFVLGAPAPSAEEIRQAVTPKGLVTGRRIVRLLTGGMALFALLFSTAGVVFALWSSGRLESWSEVEGVVRRAGFVGSVEDGYVPELDVRFDWGGEEHSATRISQADAPGLTAWSRALEPLAPGDRVPVWVPEGDPASARILQPGTAEDLRGTTVALAAALLGLLVAFAAGSFYWRAGRLPDPAHR